MTRLKRLLRSPLGLVGALLVAALVVLGGVYAASLHEYERAPRVVAPDYEIPPYDPNATESPGQRK